MKNSIHFWWFAILYTPLCCMHQPESALDSLLTRLEAPQPLFRKKSLAADVNAVKTLLQEQDHAHLAHDVATMETVITRLAQATQTTKLEAAFRLNTTGALGWLQQYRADHFQEYQQTVRQNQLAWLEQLKLSGQAYWLAELVRADSIADNQKSLEKYKAIAIPLQPEREHYLWVHAAAAGIAGRHLYNNGQQEDALFYLQKAATQSVNSRARATGSLFLGNYYAQKKQYDHAQAYFEQAQESEIKKNQMNAHIGLGKLAYEQENFKQAVSHFTIAAADTTEKEIQADALACLAKLRYFGHDPNHLPSEALQDFEKVLSLQSSLEASFWAHYYLGIIYYDAKLIYPDFAKARSHLLHAEQYKQIKNFPEMQATIDYTLGILYYWGWGLDEPNLIEARARFLKAEEQMVDKEISENATKRLQLESLKQLEQR